MTANHSEVLREVKINMEEVIQVQGKLNCKTKGGFIYILWSKKALKEQYIGSSKRTPGQSVNIGDIVNSENKAVPKHFKKTRSGIKDLVFVPFMKVRVITCK